MSALVVRLVCAACAGAVACATALADAPELDTVTVIGTLGTARAAPPGSTVIEGDELHGALPGTVLEVLDAQPGILARQKGGAGGSSYLSIRGGEPNYTQVMLEGLRVNDPTNSQGGSFDFGQLNPEALTRVEVYRGALSAVYGSDALAGAVDLRLRTLAPGEQLLRGQLQADTREGWGVGSTIGAGRGAGSVLASASAADTGRETGLSTRRRWQLLVSGDGRLGGIELRGALLHADSRRADFPEDSGGERLAVNRELERATGRLDAVSLRVAPAQRRSDRWQPRLLLGVTRQQADADTPWIASGALDGVPAIKARTDFRRHEVRIETAGPLGDALRAAVGLGHVRESGTGAGSVDIGMPIPADFSLARSMDSAFAEATAGRHAARSLTAGVRYDRPERDPGHWSARFAGRLGLSDAGPGLYASWSQGYKLPSLYALAYPLIANPTLRPERSDTVEIGIDRPADTAGAWRLAWFHSRYTDLIDFDPQRFTNVNRARVSVDGVEMEWRRALPRGWDVEVGGSYLDAHSGDGAVLRQRPHLRAATQLRWQVSAAASAWMRAAWDGGCFDSSVPTGMIRMGPRLTVDAGWRQQLAGHATVTLAVTNLLDRRAEWSVGTPAPRRALRVGLSLRR